MCLIASSYNDTYYDKKDDQRGSFDAKPQTSKVVTEELNWTEEMRDTMLIYKQDNGMQMRAIFLFSCVVSTSEDNSFQTAWIKHKFKLQRTTAGTKIVVHHNTWVVAASDITWPCHWHRCRPGAGIMKLGNL